ncbi:hypothetical protein C8Q72DRAFT_993433 [Fomitopsis betulina]|nr:hypothetical protein C8Q72DRAFT_993433 [Fomitopsis betulina]
MFFNQFVPRLDETVRRRPWYHPTDVFPAVLKVEEGDRYENIISGLNSMVANFDPQFRPRFANGNRCAVRFPFNAWEDEHCYTMPGIVMSFPGVSEADITWMKTWNGISLVVEVNDFDQDPIDEDTPWPHVNDGKRVTNVLSQLAKSARNIMLTHRMLYVFVVGIYGTQARIYCFDHAACVVSKSFDIKTCPWPLHELLWRFCHVHSQTRVLPEGQPSGAVLGLDPTISLVSDEDLLLIEEHCKAMGKPLLLDEEKRACRWITMTKYDGDGAEIGATRYLAFRTRFLNPRLFSRGTVVVDALEEGSYRHVVVKDAWRQVARDREDAFYDKIEEFVKLEPGVGTLFGLPTVKHADDLGDRQVNKAACRPSSDDPAPAGSGSTSSSSAAAGSARVPTYEVCHRTICGALRSQTPDSTAQLNERSHMRLVVETVGRPLHEFSSTRELVQVIRDAIIGHRQAYRAGIIHRDISNNNVLIYDGSAFTRKLRAFIGFLIDFDYGFYWKTALKIAGWPEDEESWKEFVADFNAKLLFKYRTAATDRQIRADSPEDQAKWEAQMKIKERTGTLLFMAIEVLRTCVAHEVHHDLESFFWLLIWVVFRHTAHSQSSDCELFLTLFGPQTAAGSAAAKYLFLAHLDQDHEWSVPGNKPLNTLIAKFKVLVADQNPVRGGTDPRAPVYLTYESVLAIFNEALADSSWPTDDKALPFSLPKSMNSSQSENKNTAKRVWDDADLDDPFATPPEPAPKRVKVCNSLCDKAADVEDETCAPICPGLALA